MDIHKMDANLEEMFNHLLRLYLDLSERHRYLVNKLVIYEKMAALKAEIKEEKSGGIPENSVEVAREAPRKRGRPPKKPAAEQRVRFDSSATSDV